MTETTYSRKLDTSGRIMLPSRLREEMGFVSGEVYQFFLTEENGETFVCLKCPRRPETQVEKAKRLLENNGFEVSKPTVR